MRGGGGSGACRVVVGKGPRSRGVDEEGHLTMYIKKMKKAIKQDIR